ncbi:hypothetical protein, partial [Staphylococcus felis]|uniref:hypothetical protein n=1 Tax=Staphylococcus felis TaxID=46127 RepID=UPI001EE7A6DC
SSRLLSLRLEFEQNSSNSKNCSSNFEELRSYAENSACETPSIKRLLSLRFDFEQNLAVNKIVPQIL